MVISYRQEMVATHNPSIDFVDIVHSWMIDCLGNGARPKNEEWRDMTVMADLCNYNRRIVGFYRGQTSMTPVTGYLHPDSDVWVEVEWITEDHDEKRRLEGETISADGYMRGQTAEAARYRSAGVFGWQCLRSNCAAINLFTGDVLDTEWHFTKVTCRQCDGENRLLSKEEWQRVNADTSHEAGYDYEGNPYTNLVPLLVGEHR